MVLEGRCGVECGVTGVSRQGDATLSIPTSHGFEASGVSVYELLKHFFVMV